MSIAEPPSPTIAAPSVVPTIGITDGELLLRFSKHGCQQSFAQLVDAHGPLVWATCRQVLCHHDDVEDAFQATFLILARRAKDIRASDSAAPWLYRVAYRTSLALSRQRRAKGTEALGDREVLDDRPDPLEHLHQQHLVAVLVEELRALPERYQAPLVLCYLEGRSRTAVAEVLDCTVATVKGRLARGRQLLRQRLARRGVALSMAATAAATAVTQAESALAGSTVPAATASAALTPITPSGEVALSTTVSQLVKQGTSAMTYASLMKPCGVIAATLLLGVATAVALDEPTLEAVRPGTTAALGIDPAVELETAATDSDLATAPQVDTAPSVEIAANSPPGDSPAALPPTSFEAVQVPGNDGPAIGFRPPTATTTAQFRNDVLFTRHPAQPIAVPLEAQPGPEQLELMHKYWQARAEGLRLKADALARQAQKDGDSLKIAEAKLAEADSYEADAERLAVAKRIEQLRTAPPAVDPVLGMPGMPQRSYAVQGRPSEYVPALPRVAGQPLRIVIEQREDGEQRQMVLIVQADPDGKISLPGMIDGSIKVKDMQKAAREIQEKFIQRLEATSNRKVEQGDIRVRVIGWREEGAPTVPALTPPTSTIPAQDPEKDQLRNQLQQLQREITQIRMHQQQSLPPTFPAPTAPAPLTSPGPVPPVPGNPLMPAEVPTINPGSQPPIPPTQAPMTAPGSSEEIEQLRRRLEQLEKAQQQSAPATGQPSTLAPPATTE